MFTGRTDAEAEAPILWSPDAQSRIIRKDPKAGKDWRQKGMIEDEMVGWHHRLNGHEFKQAPGDGEGQGSLACCSPWGRKESNMTEWLNNNNLEYIKNVYNNNKKKQTTHFKKWTLNLNIHFSTVTQTWNKYMKRCSTSLAIRKCKSKPQWNITWHQQWWLYFKKG